MSATLNNNLTRHNGICVTYNVIILLYMYKQNRQFADWINFSIRNTHTHTHTHTHTNPTNNK